MKRLLISTSWGGPAAKRLLTYAAASCLFAVSALAPSVAAEEKAGVMAIADSTPGATMPAPPGAAPLAERIDKLKVRETFTFPPGTTIGNALVRVAGMPGNILQGAATGSRLDCNTFLAWGRACITNVVSTLPNLLTIRNLQVINGYDDASTASEGDACLRFYGGGTDIVIDGVDVAHCSNGIHGAARSWTLRNVHVTGAGNKRDGKSHGLYVNSPPEQPCAFLTIEDSLFDTGTLDEQFPLSPLKAFGTPGNGHQVKSGCKVLNIRRTTLVDSAAANSGDAINTYLGGDVNLEDVTIIARQASGQPSILSNGDPNRGCGHGPGVWRFKNVTIIDEGGNGLVRWICGQPQIVLEGTNLIPAYLKLQ